MNTSGTQRPVAQAASCDAIAGGTSDVLRQWAPPAASHVGSVDGSRSGGPVYGHAATVGPESCGGADPASVVDFGVQTPPPVLLDPLPMSHAPVGFMSSGLM